MLPSKVHATRQFVDDFEVVANYYGLHESGEYELAKQVARDDLENAVPCYARMAELVRALA